MILEGFEIENWSCIKKVSVTSLPPTGVIVLHGPNRSKAVFLSLRGCTLEDLHLLLALTNSLGLRNVSHLKRTR